MVNIVPSATGLTTITMMHVQDEMLFKYSIEYLIYKNSVQYKTFTVQNRVDNNGVYSDHCWMLETDP